MEWLNYVISVGRQGYKALEKHIAGLLTMRLPKFLKENNTIWVWIYGV